MRLDQNDYWEKEAASLEKDLEQIEDHADAMHDWLTEVAEENAELKQHLGNVLARIHGDGGHHMDKVGIEQAVADADSVIVDLRRQVKELQSITEQDQYLIEQDEYLIEELRQIFAPDDAKEEVGFDMAWVKKVKDYRLEAKRCRKIAKLLCEHLQVNAVLTGIWRVPGKEMNIEMFMCAPTLNEANLGPAARMIIDGIWREQDGLAIKMGKPRVGGTEADDNLDEED